MDCKAEKIRSRATQLYLTKNGKLYNKKVKISLNPFKI